MYQITDTPVHCQNRTSYATYILFPLLILYHN